jgi:hypothetical protein
MKIACIVGGDGQKFLSDEKKFPNLSWQKILLLISQS